MFKCSSCGKIIDITELIYGSMDGEKVAMCPVCYSDTVSIYIEEEGGETIE